MPQPQKLPSDKGLVCDINVLSDILTLNGSSGHHNGGQAHDIVVVQHEDVDNPKMCSNLLQDRLTFPQIWVESVCESEDEAEEANPKVDEKQQLVANGLRRPKDKVIRSLHLTSYSNDVSFESTSTSSRQNSFQLSSRENSLDGGCCFYQSPVVDELLSPSPGPHSQETNRATREERETDSCCSREVEEEEEAPASSSERDFLKTDEATAADRSILSPAEREGKTSEGHESTPVASIIEEWLCRIETIGFSAGLVQSFARDSIDEEDDDTWFEKDVVRVFDPYYDVLEPEEIVEVDGRRDSKTNGPLGVCTVKLTNGDEIYGTFKNGVRQGRGSIEGSNLLDHGLVLVKGIYKDGVLMGMGKAILAEGSLWSIDRRITLEGVFNDGYLEGPVRGMDLKGNLIFVGQYQRGLPVGACWLAKEGQGWLYGQVDDKGRFTGENIAYVYPDRSTSMIGLFRQEQMLQALASHITTANFNEADILCLVIAVLEENKDRRAYSYCPSDRNGINCNWSLTDCYEDVTVACCASRVDGAGEGLFARRDLPKDKIVAYYNGVKVNQGETYSTSNFNYQIYVDWTDTDHSPFVDVPAQCTDISVYKASLAHKANHSFQPNCRYVAIEHPRFGRIPALMTMSEVKKGQELFSHYKYDMALAPTWYQEAWEQFQRASQDDEEEAT